MAALDDVKAALRVSGTDHDALLTRLITSSLAEFNNYSGGTPISSADVLPADAFNGLVLMIRADLDADPTERMQYLEAARNLWHPYRSDMGV